MREVAARPCEAWRYGLCRGLWLIQRGQRQPLLQNGLNGGYAGVAEVQAPAASPLHRRSPLPFMTTCQIHNPRSSLIRCQSPLSTLPLLHLSTPPLRRLLYPLPHRMSVSFLGSLPLVPSIIPSLFPPSTSPGSNTIFSFIFFFFFFRYS